jgi:tetratricopeptide (TPR) repeat protein
MSPRHAPAHSPRPAGLSGAPPGGAAAALGKFVLRFGAAYGALFLVWQPIQGWLMRLLAAGADTVLGMVERPPIITALTSQGNIVTAHSYLRGSDLSLASWNGSAVHLFAMVPLALMLAVPRGTLAERARRAALAIPPLSFVMLIIVVVQMKTVADDYARRNLGIEVYSPGERAFLGGANRVLILVGMLLLPAFFFLMAYVSVWSMRVADAAARRRAPHAQRTAMLVALGACFGAWLWLLQPRDSAGSGEAAEGVRRILELNPSSAKAQFIAGFHAEGLGHSEEALQAYNAALALDADLVEAHFGRGNVLLKREDFEEAARSYEEVLRRDPRHAPARINLGKTLAQRKLYEPAMQDFNQVLEADPGNALARYNLGLVLLRMKRPCEALPHLERAIRMDRRYYGDPTLNEILPRLRSDCAAGAGPVPAAPVPH